MILVVNCSKAGPCIGPVSYFDLNIGADVQLHSLFFHASGE